MDCVKAHGRLAAALLGVLALGPVGCGGGGSSPDLGIMDNGLADVGVMDDMAVDLGVGDSSMPVDATQPLDGGNTPERGVLEVLTGETATGFTDGVGLLARMNGIAGAEISPDGSTLYVADTFNSLIRRIDIATGAVTTIVGAPGQAAVADGVGLEARVSSPRGTGMAPDGSAFYFADSNTIRRVALPSLETTVLAGVPGMSGYVDGTGDEARFAFLVHDIEVSADGGTLYLADRSNRVIRALDLTTLAVTTVAGVQHTGPTLHADGVGDVVRLSGLGGMARVGDALYFADTFNNCIRRFDLTSGEVSTVAGDPTQQGNQDGVGSAATFDIPQQLSSDGTYLYVMGFNGVIRRVRLSDYTVDTILGDALDVRPLDGVGADVRLGVSFGPSPIDAVNGVLYFNDRDANSFRAVSLATLSTTTLAGASDPTGDRDGTFAQARFSGPADVVCEADGRRCYVSDAGNHTVRLLDRTTGQVSTLAGAPGDADIDDGAFADARFASPQGLALDEANSRLFVADQANHTVRVLDLEAETVSTLAGEPELSGDADGVGAAARFSSPVGLALNGAADVLYVADAGNSAIRRIVLSTASVELVAGEPGTSGDADGTFAEARFRSPRSLLFGADGTTLYVADRSAHVVRVLDLNASTVSTLVGVGGESGVADGTLDEARLSGPSDLALSPDGALLVAELQNGIVRRIVLSGTTETWLGNPATRGNIPSGAAVPLSEATLYFPTALTVVGNDLLLLAEDAVLEARPDGTW